MATGYEQGDFDGYAVQATVTDGVLTIAPGAGAFDPTLCFIEIGPEGTTITPAVEARLAALVESMTTATYAPQAPSLARRQYVFGSYVDELLSYTNNGTRYFTHSNHLYSPSAVTNAAGQVQERYRYDAYGKQTITTATGTVRNQSAVGFSRGFTGYILDEETGLYYARARMYSAGLGRFVSRDNLSYIDGYLLYQAYFVPNGLDPSGNVQWGKIFSGVAKIALGIGSIAGGVAVGGGTGGAGAALTVFLVVNGNISIASGLVDFAVAFTGGSAMAPSSVIQVATTMTIAATNTQGTLAGDIIQGAGEVADLFTPNGLPQAGVRRVLVTAVDATQHVKTIADKSAAVYSMVSGGDAGAMPPSPGPNAGGTVDVPFRLNATFTLDCKAEFSPYQVKAGDNLWKIWSQRDNKSISWGRMLEANVFLKNPDRIYPSEYVCAPCLKGE